VVIFVKIENLSWVRKFERRLRVITFIEGHRYSILNNNCEHFFSSKSDR